MAAPRQINFSSAAFWCYALAVCLLPIGLGGDRPIPFGLAQTGLCLSCLFLVLSPDIWKQIQFSTRLRYALGLLANVLVWALIQTLPFVPESWAHPLWQSTAVELGMPVHGGISIVPEDSLNGLTRLTTYIGGGLLAYILAQDPRRARQLVWAIWAVGTGICVYGLIVKVSGNQWVLWFPKWAYPDDLTATFVNRNHFAIYAGMVLVCGTALLIQSWREGVQRRKPHQKIEALRDWLLMQAIPKIFLLAIVMLCILLSDSRAGFVLSLVGLGSYLFFYQIYLRAWWRAVTIGVLMVIVLAAAGVVAMSFSAHFAELFNDWSSISRFSVYELTWRAIIDNPWLGYGINGFEPEYRLYQQSLFVEFTHAHSDVLEALLDYGIPVGLTMWASVILMLTGLLHGIVSRRQNGLFPTLAMAVSIVALGHALIDFDLQIPGVAMTWAALLGTGLAQSWSRVSKPSPFADL